MSKQNEYLKSTIVLTLGQIVSYGFSFVRNILLARMLSKADFGLAAVFAMTISLLEISGRMSFGQQIIQSKDGGSLQFQAASQLFQFVLSAAGACLIICLSHPAASSFMVPQAAWAFAFLAVVPLAKGFEHLDYFCQQREFNFLPGVLCEVVPQAVVTLAAWPLAVWLGDFRVIVWIMASKAILGMLMTHCLARQPYRWEWHRELVNGMWVFGWPLLLNGLLMFAGQQADQVLVGSFFSLEKLAPYALALSLASIPWMIFGQVASSLMLPIMARAQDDFPLFTRNYRTCMEYAALGSVAFTVPLIIGGEQIVRVLYGPKYIGTGVLIGILAAATAVRFLRFAPTIASMARADTVNQLYSNIWRSVSLPFAGLVILAGGGMVIIASCALFAELLATYISIIRLRNRQGIALRESSGAALYVLCFVGIGLALTYLGVAQLGLVSACAIVLTVLALSVVVAWFVFPTFALVVANIRRRKGLIIGEQPAVN